MKHDDHPPERRPEGVIASPNPSIREADAAGGATPGVTSTKVEGAAAPARPATKKPRRRRPPTKRRGE